MTDPVYGAFGTWKVEAPLGLTDKGRIQKFQRVTVERLRARAEGISDSVWQQLVSAVRANYREGTGEVAEGIQRPSVTSSATGVSVVFNYSGPGHIVFLTAAAGLPLASPGHLIPHGGTSRFYWRNPLYGLKPGIYRFSSNKPAFWRPRRAAGDVISDTLAAGAQWFRDSMLAENDRAVLEFVQNDLSFRGGGRSPRVNVVAGSGISPQ